MLRIGFEGDLGGAPRAADVEAEDADGVVLLVGRLFACVEFAAFVDVLAAAGALHAEGRHESHDLLLGASLLGTAPAVDGGRVEVGWVVLLEDFAFRHGGGFGVSGSGVGW